MEGMFWGSKFNGDISGWNMSIEPRIEQVGKKFVFFCQNDLQFYYGYFNF